MILSADIELAKILPIFSSLGIHTSFLVPIATAMEKSIMDATHPVREHIKAASFHDFSKQEQGTDAKVLKTAYFVHPDKLEETQASLYRPSTKNGDPRIWFYGLKNYAESFNLLAVVPKGDKIYVINCSNKLIVQSLERGLNPLLVEIGISAIGLTQEAEELLNLLRKIGQKGWIKTMRSGDTGEGYTLETLLGISANSNKAPDYKGIEIKSGRVGSSNQTLFSKTPDWALSRLKSSLEILKARGRYSEAKKRNQLFHSIRSDRPNSYGLQLEVDFELGQLSQFCLETGARTDDVIWELKTLQEALKKKHRQTFWVKTKTRKQDQLEHFLYSEAVYTRAPNIDAFALLLEVGEVFVDYTIKETKTGAAKDQGYLFRMKQNNLNALFGVPRSFELS